MLVSNRTPNSEFPLPSLLQIQSSSPAGLRWVTLSQHGEASEWGRNWMNIHSPSGSQTRQCKIPYLVRWFSYLNASLWWIFHLAMFDDSRGYHHSLALFSCGAGRRAEPPCGRLPLAFQTDLQEHFRSGAVLDDANQLYWNRNFYGNHRGTAGISGSHWTRTWPTVWDTQFGAAELAHFRLWCQASLWKYLLEKCMDPTTKIDETSESVVDWCTTAIVALKSAVSSCALPVLRRLNVFSLFSA